jgi:arginyl-tRNA synthetase
MRLLAESTQARYLEAIGRAGDFPKEGYLGDYVVRIARKIVQEHNEAWADADLDRFKAFAQEALFAEIRATLERLGIAFDVYFNETSVIDSLRKEKLAYEKDGALWFTGSAFGLDKDRVIVKSTGEPTYRLPDMAYHINKLSRGFDWIVDIFGADHESTYRDVLAGLTALGHDVSRVRVLIHQFVTLLKDGKQVRMGKREGNYVTLDDLMGEVGVDAVRFFFLQRRHDAHLEFDTDLARRKSEENPVYYVQYAHARIASVLGEAAKQGIALPATPDQAHPERLVLEEERELLGQLAEYPDLVERAALALEPHRLVFYLLDLARDFHAYYNGHRFISSDDSSLTVARLGLVSAVARVLRAGLSIIGVNAPERM